MLTSLSRRNLFLLTFCFNLGVCLGVSLNITGSSHSVLGQSFTFTCIVTDAANLNDGVDFHRTAYSIPLGGLDQAMATCSVFIIPPDGYTVACGSGTNSTLATTKIYTLVINSAARSDDSTWWCQLTAEKTRSNTFRLPVYYGPVEGRVKFNSTTSVEGQDLTVDCTADCNPPCDYSWTLGDNKITTSPLLNLTDISSNQDGNVYNCTVTNSAIPKTISELFILKVDYDPERMSALSAGAISGIVIAVVLALFVPTVWILYKRKIKKKAEDVQNESNN
ncbi:carcinoembryonic antigen-related cell adhesion molecule 8-like [Gigantopelta aegis]|uniref:carcinoembryonic antigen-related cell adhesion molecule 8-like n=1 Tax=Gigantopelta aegis TaxID=1735272 RepID=UPI001B887B78|nr:carcinoembryonic antigen-related cell adhesion molecule 8-like [Gigantopelta aegis]